MTVPLRCCATCLLLASPAGADWPQFLGPHRDGRAPDAKVAGTFAGDGPQIVWRHEVGSGFAGPAVAGGSVYIFHRKGDRAVIEALTADSGEPRWEFGYATDYVDDFGFDNGPRAVPLVAGDKVYLFGAEGMAHCLDAKSGAELWSKDLRGTLGADKGFFGRAVSPLLAGGSLILQIGGDRAGIVGLDPDDGSLKWRSPPHEAGYASPVRATLAGRGYTLHFTRAGFVCLDPAGGKVVIDRRHRSAIGPSVNAASPVFVPPDKVFLSACYGVGAALWQIDPARGEVTPVWAAGDRLDCHYATPVLYDDHLIGFHGRQESGTELRCIEAAGGGLKWSSGRLPAGSATLAGDTLVALTERGELVLAAADTERFEPTARGQVLANGTRAYPALSGGHLFARDKRQLVCVRLKP